MASPPNECVRLPGLFRWSEVRDAVASNEEGWHFVAKPYSSGIDGRDALYVVYGKPQTQDEPCLHEA